MIIIIMYLFFKLLSIMFTKIPKKDFIWQLVCFWWSISNRSIIDWKKLSFDEAIEFLDSKTQNIDYNKYNEFSEIIKHSDWYKRKTENGFSYGVLNWNHIEVLENNNVFVVTSYEKNQWDEIVRDICIYIKKV